MDRLFGWLYLAAKGGWTFCFDGIGPGEQSSADCDCSLRDLRGPSAANDQVFKSGILSSSVQKRVVSRGKKSRSCGTIVARLRAVFGIHSTKAACLLSPNEEETRRIKKKLYMKKSRQIRNAMLFDLSRLTRDHFLTRVSRSGGTRLRRESLGDLCEDCFGKSLAEIPLTRSRDR
jgi:hypothetical protein